MERRTFFKLIGVSALATAGTAAVTACSPSGTMPPFAPDVPEQESAQVANDPVVAFTSEVDVLVVGSGIAGLSAAMAPAEAGRSVMVADKLDLLGGESFSSCGVMRVSGSALQRRVGIDITAIEAWDARKQELANAGVSDLDFAKRLFVIAPDWADHLTDSYGAKFADPRSYVEAGGPETVLLPENGLGDMESVMSPLRDGLSGKGVTFFSGMRAVAFVLDEAGSVCGMRFVAEKNGAINDVRARRVVVATGGFASSQPLMHTYLPDQERVGCYTFSSMGEGQLLCTAVGGQLADMAKAGPLTSDVPQAAAWGLFGPTIIVNPFGIRFAREDSENAAADACFKDALGFWWTVFDQQLVGGSQSRNVAQMTAKLSQRLVGPVDTLDDLAAALTVSADVLKATFDAYDQAVDEQKDAAFGRTRFLQKLSAPYYALRQLPVRYKTRGGAKTDGDGRLLNATGSPVANVYCCGSVGASSVEGLASNGAYGMLVGQAVAKALDSEDTEKKDAAS